ncbi:MAG: T9SS type A sorting domain-containing protein [Muribaculaceae bacterium]
MKAYEPIGEGYPEPTYNVVLSGTSSDGYCTARLSWLLKDVTPAGTTIEGLYRVVSTDLYRDGVLYKKGLAWSTFIDKDIPQGSVKYKVIETVEYYIDEIQKDAEGNKLKDWTGLNDSTIKVFSRQYEVESNEISLDIKERNMAKVNYHIDEIYNLRLGADNKANSHDGVSFVPSWSSTQTNVPRFTINDMVRGCFHVISKRDGKGYWFFVDNGFGSWGTSSSLQDSNVRIIKVADDAASIADPTKYKVVLNVPRTGSPKFIYIALDEWENIFCRAGSAFSETPTQYQIFRYDDYNTNSSASAWKTGTFDKNFAEFAVSGQSGQLGRCDQLSVQGFIDSGECTILMAPGKGPYCFRLKLNNGDKVSESWAKITPESGSDAVGTENDCIFVDGPNNKNRIIYQNRSNYYAHFKFPADGVGDVSAEANGAIISYVSQYGQVNQSGGATLYFEGTAANGVMCKDLFFASSVAFSSKGSGSFQVNLAQTDCAKEEATDANFIFSDMAPLGSFAQREENTTGTAQNANLSSLFFTLEPDATYPDRKHIYIYQYVPLYRIAKYEIVPEVGFTTTPIEIKIDKIESASTGITSFNNSMFFSKPVYGENPEDEYEIKGYSIVLTDPDGNRYHYSISAKGYTADGKVVYKREIRMADEDGNPTSEKVQVYNDKGYPQTYVDGSGVEQPLYYEDTVELPADFAAGDFVQDYSLPFPLTSLGTYNASISVWVGRKGYDEYIQCEPQSASIPVTLETRVPDPLAQAFRYDPEQDHNNGSIMASDPSLPYRIDGAFTMPSDGPDPVSYYEVYINGEKQVGYWVVENGIPTFCTSNKGTGYTEYNREKSDVIPADYDFDNDPNPTSPVAWKGNEETGEYEYGDGMPNTIFSVYLPVPSEAINEDGSINWDMADGIVGGYKICVKPVYAAGTNFETRTENCTETGLPGTTAVDEISAGAVTVYPIPAESEVSIAAPFAIEEVKFFSVSGALVKTVKFAGSENEVSVDVQNLAQGFYYININGKVSQKFIKR